MLQKALKEFDEEIKHGGNIIPFKVLMTRRRTMSIIVYPDQSVTVRAPLRTSMRYIKKSVENRADWIISKQTKFSHLPKPSLVKKYEDGDVFHFMGNELKLRINQDLVNRVDIEDGDLIVRMTKITKEKVKKLICDWYKVQAEKIFLDRLEICKDMVADIGIKYNSMPKLRQMRSMWGNCSRKGEIKLSYELIKKPLHCIDYVIVHELCHIKEFNHSKAFYELLNHAMPDWKSRRADLKR
jgi:predicted metal-dependent hydrolase